MQQNVNTFCIIICMVGLVYLFPCAAPEPGPMGPPGKQGVPGPPGPMGRNGMDAPRQATTGAPGPGAGAYDAALRQMTPQRRQYHLQHLEHCPAKKGYPCHDHYGHTWATGIPGKAGQPGQAEEDE